MFRRQAFGLRRPRRTLLVRARDMLQTVRILKFAPVIAAGEGLVERCSQGIDGKL